MMQAKRCSATKVRHLNVSLPVSEDSEASTWKKLVPAESSMLWSEVGPLYDGRDDIFWRESLPTDTEKSDSPPRDIFICGRKPLRRADALTLFISQLKHFHRTVPRPGPGTGPLSRAVRVTVTVVAATGPAVAEGKLLGRPAGGSRGLRCQGGDGRGRDGPVGRQRRRQQQTRTDSEAAAATFPCAQSRRRRRGEPAGVPPRER